MELFILGALLMLPFLTWSIVGISKHVAKSWKSNRRELLIPLGTIAFAVGLTLIAISIELGRK